jgi:hypothetical protein
MRRITTAASLFAAGLMTAVLGVANPAAAASNGGWVRFPTPSFDQAAGVECDFPIHAQPIIDQVYGKTTKTFPDGTPEQQIFVGPLVVRVTNTDNGHSYDADASGSAIVDYGTDGSQFWRVIGPVLLGSKAGTGNLPRGLWVVDGVYTIAFTADGHKTVTLIHGTEDNVCDHIA